MRSAAHQEAVEAIKAIHVELRFDAKPEAFYDDQIAVERHLNWLLYERRHAARAPFPWRQYAEETLAALSASLTT